MHQDHPVVVIDDFDGPHLNRTRWIPAYLPHWSFSEEAQAGWTIANSFLSLSISRDHPVWCEPSHHPPIRVSGIQ